MSRAASARSEDSVGLLWALLTPSPRRLRLTGAGDSAIRCIGHKHVRRGTERTYAAEAIAFAELSCMRRSTRVAERLMSPDRSIAGIRFVRT